jgi:hypothetical protein
LPTPYAPRISRSSYPPPCDAISIAVSLDSSYKISSNRVPPKDTEEVFDVKLLLRGSWDDEEVADDERDGPAVRLPSYGEGADELEVGDMTVT